MQRPTTCQGRVLAFAAAAIAALLAAPALAAPQVLALIATDVPVPLRCADGVCRAELASLCLQPERRAPAAGRLYRPDNAAAIELVGHDATRHSPLPATARLIATRTHVAVRLELPQTWIADHVGAAAAVRVAATTALLPVPRASDSRPLTATELARATGPDLSLAAGIIDADPARRAAIALSAQLINRLPDAADAATAERLWRRLAATLPGELRRADATGLARFQFDWCRYSAANGLSPGLSQCLAAQQDRAMEALHDGYLAALGAGS